MTNGICSFSFFRFDLRIGAVFRRTNRSGVLSVVETSEERSSRKLLQRSETTIDETRRILSRTTAVRVRRFPIDQRKSRKVRAQEIVGRERRENHFAVGPATLRSRRHRSELGFGKICHFSPSSTSEQRKSFFFEAKLLWPNREPPKVEHEEWKPPTLSAKQLEALEKNTPIVI